MWERLNEEHVDRGDFNSDEFAEGAIRGMIEVLDDRNTNYVRPEAFQIQRSDIEGKFEGIGAHVTMRRDGILIIMSPLPGSPAEAMGLKPGDAVLAVDGVSIEGLSLLEAVARIRGPKGSEVVLTIKHLTAIDPIDITLTRDVIPLVSVLLRSEPGDRIAHIRLTEFYGNTAGTLEETLQEAVDEGAKGLILDVRDNPGGLLSSVIDVVSQFMSDGLVSLPGRRQRRADRDGDQERRDNGHPHGGADQRVQRQRQRDPRRGPSRTTAGPPSSERPPSARAASTT